MVSLLSNPDILPAAHVRPLHAYAYATIIATDIDPCKLLPTKPVAIYVLPQEEDDADDDAQDDNAPQPSAEDMETLMTQVESNTRNLTSLMRQKNKVFGQMQARMDLLRYERRTLGQEQISRYAAFMHTYDANNSVVAVALDKMSQNHNLQTIKEDLLHNSGDFQTAYAKLGEVSAYQQEAQTRLHTIITEGTGVLAML